MRMTNLIKGAIVAVAFFLVGSDAFSAPVVQQRWSGRHAGTRAMDVTQYMGTTSEDCGCPTQVSFSGKPPDQARMLNHREAIRKHGIYSVSGNAVTMDELIGSPASKKVSIVVFLRSLG